MLRLGEAVQRVIPATALMITMIAQGIKLLRGD
jgi:hypothetical protein